MAIFLHIDMDAFFAAVEALDHPQWQGKPLIVGADPKEGKGRGVVSTASYEARKFGVHSALPIRTAWQRCPHGIYVPPNMPRYVDVSDQIMEIFKGFTPLVQPISLDEAFLDITGSQRLHGDPVTMARKIKAKILDRTALTCSVGVSWVKSVAKIASDMNKPNGLTVVPQGEERAFLAPLHVRKLWGIGPKAEAVLARAGIRTVGQIQARSRARLVRLFGKAGGEHYWNMAHALDPREVCDDEKALSISHETTFLADTRDPEVIARTLLWLADKVSSRLRANQIQGRVLTLKYRTESFRTFTRRVTLDEAVSDTRTLYDQARALAATLEGKGNRVRLLGIGMSRLEHCTQGQARLFDDPPAQDQKSTDRVVDRVRARYGTSAIFRGSLMNRKGNGSATRKKGGGEDQEPGSEGAEGKP